MLRLMNGSLSQTLRKWGLRLADLFQEKLEPGGDSRVRETDPASSEQGPTTEEPFAVLPAGNAVIADPSIEEEPEPLVEALVVPSGAIKFNASPSASTEVVADERNSKDIHVIVNGTSEHQSAQINVLGVGDGAVHIRSNDERAYLSELTVSVGATLCFGQNTTVATLRLAELGSEQPVTFAAATSGGGSDPLVVVEDVKPLDVEPMEPGDGERDVLPSTRPSIFIRLQECKIVMPTSSSDDVSVHIELDRQTRVVLDETRPMRSFFPHYDFVGDGEICIKSDARHLTLKHREDRFPHVEVEKRVSLQAAGAARFTLHDGAILKGDFRRGVGVQALRSADNAELRRVRLFDLPLSDLSNLRRASRLEPWWHAKAHARNPNLMFTLDAINQQIPDRPLRRSLTWRVLHLNTWIPDITTAFKRRLGGLREIWKLEDDDFRREFGRWLGTVTRWSDPIGNPARAEVAGRWQGISEAVRLRGTSGRDVVWAAFIGQEMRRITAAGRAERLLLHVSASLGHGCIIQRPLIWLATVVTFAAGWLGTASGIAKPFFLGAKISAAATGAGLQLWIEIFLFPVLSIRGGTVPPHTQEAITVAGLDGQLLFLVVALISIASWISLAVAVGRLLRTQRTAPSVTG